MRSCCIIDVYMRSVQKRVDKTIKMAGFSYFSPPPLIEV